MDHHAQPRPSYVLPPLQKARSQIRLLYLYAGQAKEPIRASLSIHNIDQAPAYNAISYTWGEDVDQEVILIDGASFPVRKNCRYALWQARLHHPNKYSWIDAICINQDDDVEKSSQVAMMGQIFANAELMLACVGAQADDSGYLTRCGYPDWLGWKAMSIYEQREWLLARVDLPRAISASAALMNRPYWERLWVVQEVALAARKIILCGGRCLDWSVVGVADQGSYGTTPSARRSTITSCAGTGRFQPLSQIMALCRDHKCADPRDHIYALLAIVQWPDNVVPLRADYTKSRLQLAVDVLPHVTRLLRPLVMVLNLSSDEALFLYAVQRWQLQSPTGTIPEFSQTTQ